MNEVKNEWTNNHIETPSPTWIVIFDLVFFLAFGGAGIALLVLPFITDCKDIILILYSIGIPFFIVGIYFAILLIKEIKVRYIYKKHMKNVSLYTPKKEEISNLDNDLTGAHTKTYKHTDKYGNVYYSETTSYGNLNTNLFLVMIVSIFIAGMLNIKEGLNFIFLVIVNILETAFILYSIYRLIKKIPWKNLTIENILYDSILLCFLSFWLIMYLGTAGEAIFQIKFNGLLLLIPFALAVILVIVFALVFYFSLFSQKKNK